MNTGLRASLGLLACLLSGTVAADSNLRCGSKLVELGSTAEFVLEYCGEPTSKTVEVQDVRANNRVVGQTEIHRWRYEKYSSTKVLTFQDGKLMSID
jgi:hypothetical protein